MRQFLKTAGMFALGLVVTLAAVERFLGWRLAYSHGKFCVAPEIYEAIERAQEPSSSVHTVLLGDSVARELFPPGSERRSDDRFLACNQAGSLAAQYYILSDALRSFPELRDVYLLYYPGSFENDLGPPLSNDFFCGFFHAPKQIREVFEVKRDARLAMVQFGRLLLPNILAANSVNRPTAWQWVPPRPGIAPTSFGSANEPLADLLDRLWGSEPAQQIPAKTAAGRPVFLSRISEHYLPKMRELCRSRGVAFHVLPCPCSDAERFNDFQHVYERAIIYVPAAEFGDGIHLRKPFVPEMRQRLIVQYGLPSDASR